MGKANRRRDELIVVFLMAAMGGASVLGPPRFNDADVGAAKELRLRGSRFCPRRRVVVSLLSLVAEDVDDEAEEEAESHVIAPPLFCCCCLLLDDDCSIFLVINN